MAMTGDTKGLRNAINVTPLVDVVLVLLIIFMVVTPLLHQGKKLELAPSTSIEPSSPADDRLIVSITADRKIWVDEQAVDDALLERTITSALADRRARSILLKADRSLSVREVRRVMDRARSAGATKIALGVREIKKP